MPDNLADLRENFEYKEDARFAGGYAYFCHHCGLEMQCWGSGLCLPGREHFADLH